MKSSSLLRIHALTFTLSLCIALALNAGAARASESAPPRPKRVLDLNYGDKIATARLRVPPEELRELIYRLLDEDGFRVVRIVGSIPKEGQTLKAKKHLRRTECELIPDLDPNISTLSFEYGRFGNRDWSEKALNMIVAELGKNEVLDEKPRTVVETPEPPPKTIMASDKPKPAAISGTDYYESKVEIPPDNPLPIPALSIDPDSPAPFDKPAAAARAPAAVPDPLASPAASHAAGGGEVVTLPGQKNVQGPHPAESLFRGIQRGEINEKSGQEKIDAFLQVAWLDASHAPTDAQRRALASRLAHALSERQIGSRDAGSLVGLIDRAVGPAQVAAPAIGELKAQFDSILERGDFDDAEKTGWRQDVGSLLVATRTP